MSYKKRLESAYSKGASAVFLNIVIEMLYSRSVDEILKGSLRKDIKTKIRTILLYMNFDSQSTMMSDFEITGNSYNTIGTRYNRNINQNLKKVMLMNTIKHKLKQIENYQINV